MRGVELGGASVCFRVAKQASIGWTNVRMTHWVGTYLGITRYFGSLQFHRINLSGQGLSIYSQMQ